MFTRPQPHLVCSDEGYCIEVLGRAGVRYREGDITLFVDGEMLAGSHGFVIYSNRITPVGQFEPIPMDDVERHRIIENVHRAFAYMGFDIEIA